MAAPTIVPEQQAKPNDLTEPIRIAMVAPPYFHIPPRGYGGVEMMLANLVDALVDRGHEVTLIAAGTHATKAQRFLSTMNRSLEDRLGEALPEVAHAARVGELLEGCDVDLVHDHTCAGALLARGRLIPTVVTVHGPVTGIEGSYYGALGNTTSLIAISDAQRRTAPDLAWIDTVHNGIDVSSFPYACTKKGFVLFLGRFHPHKAPHLAIDAARAAGLPIVLAGKCSEPVERGYFNEQVKPRLGADTTVVGIADAVMKRELLANAECLLFPICWDEPFGLVMVEAMASGTPVVALRRGSVPEVIVDGHTGIICDEPSELPEGIARARRLNPADCRSHVESTFNVSTMTSGYERAYSKLLTKIREPKVTTVLNLVTKEEFQT